MYDNAGPAIGAATGGGALASTGMGIVWIALAAFAVLAVGLAVTRIAPKFRKH